MNANFRVDAASHDGVHAVNVQGELDQATAPELRQILSQALESDDGPVFVDLSDCEFIDSTGLSLLIEVQRRLAEQDRGFAVCSPRTEVRRLLELTGIDAAVSLFDSRDDAIASLRDGGSSE